MEQKHKYGFIKKKTNRDCTLLCLWKTNEIRVKLLETLLIGHCWLLAFLLNSQPFSNSFFLLLSAHVRGRYRLIFINVDHHCIRESIDNPKNRILVWQKVRK